MRTVGRCLGREGRPRIGVARRIRGRARAGSALPSGGAAALRLELRHPRLRLPGQPGRRPHRAAIPSTREALGSRERRSPLSRPSPAQDRRDHRDLEGARRSPHLGATAGVPGSCSRLSDLAPGRDARAQPALGKRRCAAQRRRRRPRAAASGWHSGRHARGRGSYSCLRGLARSDGIRGSVESADRGSNLTGSMRGRRRRRGEDEATCSRADLSHAPEDRGSGLLRPSATLPSTSQAASTCPA